LDGLVIPQQAPPPLHIINANVAYGVNADVMRAVTIVVSDGKIERIATESDTVRERGWQLESPGSNGTSQPSYGERQYYCCSP